LTLLFNTENVYLELENEGKFVILMLALWTKVNVKVKQSHNTPM
jgi:hypothetical protein